MADGQANGTALVETSAAIRERASQVTVTTHGLAPRSLAELMDFGQLMAKAGPMVGKAFRGEPGACIAVTMQAMRWNMDPFAVSQKAYVTGDTVAYEAQLVNAVILSNAPLARRPTYSFSGEGAKRRCKVSILLRGEPEPLEYETPETTPTGNSPLWKKDLDQQLSYYAIRAWARRHMPELIMGVYTPDELQDAGVIETRVIDASGDYDQRPAEDRDPRINPKYGVIGGQAGKDVFDDLATRMSETEDAAGLEEVWAEAEKTPISQNRMDALAEHYEAVKLAHEEGLPIPAAPRFSEPPEPSPFEALKIEGEKIGSVETFKAWTSKLTPETLGKCTEDERKALKAIHAAAKTRVTESSSGAAGVNEDADAPRKGNGKPGGEPAPASSPFEKLKQDCLACLKAKAPRRALATWRKEADAAAEHLSAAEQAELDTIEKNVRAELAK